MGNNFCKILYRRFYSFLIYYLINPFITLWLGKEYILSNSVIIIILVNTYLRISNGYNASFLFGYGLFNDTWAPLTEATINIVIAIIAGSIWGLPGILMGNIISYLLIVCIWKPYFLYWKGFKKSSTDYWLNILRYIVILAISWYSFILIKSAITITPIQGYLNFIFFAITILLIFGTIYTLMMLFLGIGFNNIIHRLLNKTQ